ncbi:MAG: heavy metal-binding domain-containing protein [Gemmatimonadota bacterium]
MIITPAQTVAGRTTAEDLGLVLGNTIRARHVGRDVLAGLKSIVGGEIHDYTKMMAEARDQSLDRMVEVARQRGADAVVNVRFATSYLMGGAAEILVYGTAVRLGS